MAQIKKMKSWFWGKFREDAYLQNDKTIKKSNLKFYTLFNYIMIGLLAILYLSTFFSDYATSLKPVYLIFIGMSGVELLLIHFVHSKKDTWILYASYFGIIKAYVFCLFTSVFFNRNDSAITFYIFLILIPTCFLIRPKQMYAVQVAAAAAFCISTGLVKEPEIASGDILTCVLFFVISIVISTQISQIRINNISMIAKEHQRSIAMKNQRDLLGVAMKSANMCAWIYDCQKKRLIPTFTDQVYAPYDHVIFQMPEDLIKCGLVHRESIFTMRELYHQADSGKDFIQGDVQIRGSEQETFGWFHISMIPENGQGGNYLRYIGTLEDITERKNMELQYENQLRILNSANEENLITKGRWNLTQNRQELEEKNREAGLDLVGMHSYDQAMQLLTSTIFPEDTRKNMTRLLERNALIEAYHKGTDRYEFKYQRCTNTQSSIWVKMQVRVCQVPGKEDIVCFGFSYDITEEVLNRSIIERLVSSEYDFLGTIDVKTEKSVLRSVQTSMKEASFVERMAHQTMDYTESSQKAANFAVVPEDVEETIANMKLANVVAHLEKKPAYILTFSTIEQKVLRRKKLEYCYLDDTKETILYYRSDITELYRKEQEQIVKMKEALAQVEMANAAKTDFLSRMSHDMRTPMNGIIGMTRMTQELPSLSPEVSQNLNAIADSSRFLLSLINDTLDMSRIERNKIVLVPEVVDTEDLIQNILGMIEISVKEKKISLEYESKHLTAKYIRVDRVRLQQILLNILSNAVKFTKEGGKIRLCIEGMEQKKGMVFDRISIEDTGIGMSEAFLAKIYEPFSQENSKMTNRQVGTGLGMSIVKNLVELMGGTIAIESRLGKGTKVILQMQFETAEDCVVQKERQILDIDALLSGKQVLLVEDHPLNLTIAKKMLEKKQMRVDTALDGKEAVEKFLGSPDKQYDLILMDIQMPVLNGIEATRQIRAADRADAKSVVIIAMSANAFAEDVKKSQEAGMNDHLSKPVEPDTLYEVLARNFQRMKDISTRC